MNFGGTLAGAKPPGVQPGGASSSGAKRTNRLQVGCPLSWG